MAMVDAGMKPKDAIVAATSSAAELLGIAECVGSVTTGKVADLLVVEGDPEEDIAVLRNRENIRAIFQSGRLVIDRGLQRLTK
jgi:imidazolonepropionase-like amidohydrolase